MEFKGTQGTWVVDHEERGFNEHGQLCTPISRKDKSYSTIIGLCDVYGKDEKSQANALLISKSPELLSDLNDLVWLIKNGATIEELEERILTSEQLIKQATEL